MRRAGGLHARYVPVPTELLLDRAYVLAPARLRAAWALAMAPPVAMSPICLYQPDLGLLGELLGGAGVDAVHATLGELAELELLGYDAVHAVVGYVDYWFACPPRDLRTFKWLLQWYRAVPDCALKGVHAGGAEDLARERGEKWEKAFAEADLSCSRAWAGVQRGLFDGPRSAVEKPVDNFVHDLWKTDA